jgi:hypothetical protein
MSYLIEDLYPAINKIRVKKCWSWTELTARLNSKCAKPLFYKAMWCRVAKKERHITIQQAIAVQKALGLKIFN